MKVLIVGAGRLGTLMAASLQRGGNDVVLVARTTGDREVVISSGGARFVTSVRTVSTIRDSAEHGPYDRVLLCVRTTDLVEVRAALLEHARVVLAPHGVALSLMNGLDSDGVLVECFSSERVVGAVVNLAVERDDTGELHVTTGGNVVVAAFSPERPERARAIAAWLTESGICCTTASDLRTLRWAKLAWNCAINAISALALCPMSDIARNPYTRALMLGVVREVMVVAAADGVLLTPALPAVYLRAAGDAGVAKSSMLQDVRAARSLEHAGLNGAVCVVAKRHRLSAPLNQALFALLDARAEATSDGKELA